MKGDYTMTRERFITIHTNRGYEVETLGKIVIIRKGNYSAYWFFNADGTPDETQEPYWTLSKES